MKMFFIIICIVVAAFTLFIVVRPSQVSVLPHEEAKAACYRYCDMGCKLNNTVEEMKKIWAIEVVDDMLGRVTCGNLVGNCICA